MTIIINNYASSKLFVPFVLFDIMGILLHFLIESQLQCNFNVKFLSFNKIEQKQGCVCFDVLNAVKLSLFNDEVSKFVMYILTMLDFFCCVSTCVQVYTFVK